MKKIAYVTDIHLDEQFPIDQGVDARKNWNIILKDISSREIDEIIFGGDIGEKSAHKWFFKSLANYKLTLTLGNHDYFKEVVKHYGSELNHGNEELYHSREDSDFKFAFLDSSSDSISDEQFDWLKKELQTDKKIILFIHHPILSVDAEVDRRFALEGRDRIDDQLQNTGNEIDIFCGHYHFEDKTICVNVRQYITPASSYQVEKNPNELKINNKTFGYRLIELTPDRIKTEVILFETT